MAEKFTRWNEPKSGINPFVPARRKWPSNFMGRAVKAVIGVLLAVLRIPLLVVLLGLLAVSSMLAKLMPLRVLGRLVKYILESPISYLMLIFLGFYGTRSTTTDRRRVHLPEDKANGRHAKPSSGDIIVASNSSFVELLYAAYRFAPMFVLSSVEGGLEEVPLITALWRSFSPINAKLSTPSEASVAKVIAAAQGFQAGPVYFQPEVARSNGRAILSYGAAAHELGQCIAGFPKNKRPSTHTLVFRYSSYKYFAPTHTADRPLPHLWWMCNQIHNKLHAITLPSTFDPQPTGDGKTWAASSRNALVEAVGTGGRAVDFGAADFNEFFEAYRNPAVRTQKRVRTYHGDVDVPDGGDAVDVKRAVEAEAKANQRAAAGATRVNSARRRK